MQEIVKTGNTDYFNSIDYTKSSRNDWLSAYRNYINSFPILSLEETIELAKRIESGDLKAKEKLVNCNLRFAYFVAKRYRGCGLEFEDLIQEANIGLEHAALKYNYRKGVTFCSYAFYWIRHEFTRAIVYTALPIHVSFRVYENYMKMIKISEDLLIKLGRYPSCLEIAKEMNLSEKYVQNLFSFRSKVSLNADVFGSEDEESNSMLLDYISNDICEYDECTSFVSFCMTNSMLSKNEKQILSMYLGLEDKIPCTCTEISKILGSSRQDIHQKLGRIFNKIRTLAKRYNFD